MNAVFMRPLTPREKLIVTMLLPGADVNRLYTKEEAESLLRSAKRKSRHDRIRNEGIQVGTILRHRYWRGNHVYTVSAITLTGYICLEGKLGEWEPRTFIVVNQ